MESAVAFARRTWPPRAMRALTSRLSVVLVVLSAACGGGSEPANSPTKAPEPAPTTTASSAASTPAPEPVKEEPPPPKALEAKPPTVKLLEPGAAPRRALRYKFKAGASEYAVMDMKMAMTMSMADKEMPKIELPTMRATMHLETKEVTADGDAKLAFDTEKVDVLKDGKADPKLVAALEEELKGLVGIKGHATITPRGIAKDTDFELPPTASPRLKGQVDSMKDAIRNMYMPLPEEEVGKGAKWLVSSRIPLTGAMMDVAATYSLQNLTTDGAQSNVDIVLSAEPNQPLQVDGLAGATATLDSLSGKGTGKTAPTFSKLVATGNSHVSMQLASSASLRGDKITTKVSTDVTVDIKPGKAPAPAKAAPAPAKK